MFQFETKQKVCEIGDIKFGGQPGDYPTVVCNSIFQTGDKIFPGKRKDGFDVLIFGNFDPYATLCQLEDQAEVESIIKKCIDDGQDSIWPG